MGRKKLEEFFKLHTSLKLFLGCSSTLHCNIYFQRQRNVHTPYSTIFNYIRWYSIFICPNPKYLSYINATNEEEQRKQVAHFFPRTLIKLYQDDTIRALVSFMPNSHPIRTTSNTNHPRWWFQTITNNNPPTSYRSLDLWTRLHR